MHDTAMAFPNPDIRQIGSCQKPTVKGTRPAGLTE